MKLRHIQILIIPALLLAFIMPVAGGGRAAAQEQAAKISASMNAFYYIPGERAYLDVDLELPEEAGSGETRVELLLYSSASTRSSLESFREGVRGYPLIRRRLETIPPGSEWTNKLYEIDLGAMGLKAGVYPLEVALTGDGETLASDFNFLVIIDPAAGYPLNLSMLWTMDFLPPTDARGGELDSGLATAVSPGATETGFLYALSKVMKRTPEVRSDMVLPSATYENLEELAGGADTEAGGETGTGAAEVLAALGEMFKSGQVGLLNATYAFADPDILVSQGWEEDASEQMELGLTGAAEMGSKDKGFINPLFHLSDSMLQRMVENGMEYTVVGAEALQSSVAGRRLLEGTTISQPVSFVNSNGYLLKAFVRDETLYSYLESTPQGDSTHMIQNIFAELAVLQREKPYVVRSCVMAFPTSFMPSQRFIEEFYGAVKGCPWLQTRHLTELNADQFPMQGIALQAQVFSESPSEYMQKLGAVRSEVQALAGSGPDNPGAIPEGNPLRENLQRSLLVAETYRFTGDYDAAAAQAYLAGIESEIQEETSKVNIGQKRSVTLSSTQGKLSVDITSNLDYPLEHVTLTMENTSLTFPNGNSMQVTIEPRENHFIFDVNTHRKGSFIVDIVMETGGLVIDSTTTTVNTSIINTLAIILLACLAGIVALVIMTRRLLRRYRGGKHAGGGRDK